MKPPLDREPSSRLNQEKDSYLINKFLLFVIVCWLSLYLATMGPLQAYDNGKSAENFLLQQLIADHPDLETLDKRYVFKNFLHDLFPGKDVVVLIDVYYTTAVPAHRYPSVVFNLSQDEQVVEALAARPLVNKLSEKEFADLFAYYFESDLGMSPFVRIYVGKNSGDTFCFEKVITWSDLTDNKVIDNPALLPYYSHGVAGTEFSEYVFEPCEDTLLAAEQ